MSSPSALLSENDPRYQGWRVAGASAIGVFFVSILVYAFAVLLEPISREFGWSRQSVSAAYSLMAAVSAVCAPWLGVLLDRYGPRRIAVPCVAVCGVGLASLAALTASRLHLYGVFALMGVAGIGTTALAYSRAVSTWFDARRGFAIALVISGGALASMTHPPVTEALIRAAGWRTACLVLGGVVLLVGLPIVAAFVRERTASRAGGTAESDGDSARAALRSWIVWVLLLVIGTATVASNGIIVHLPSLLTDRGMSPQRAALALSAMGAASLVGRLLSGWLVDRFRGTHVSFALLTIAAVGILLLARSESFEASLAAAVLIGFGLGGELDVTPFLLSRYFGLRALSTLYGFAWTAMGIAGAIGPILMGRAFDRSGSYDSLLQWLAVTTLAAAALMLTLPRYRLRTHAQPVAPAGR
jgi:predicted MFS family arabinose efflux permease